MTLRTWCVAVLMGGPACMNESGSTSSTSTASSALTAFCSIPIEDREEGAGLFNDETFGGNGRTCATCHPAGGAFTLSPEAVRARLAANRQDPLFLFDGSDDGMGHGVSRILRDATFRITRPLPPYMSIARCRTGGSGCNPCAAIATEPGRVVCDPRTVVLPRAAPSLLNIGVESALETLSLPLFARQPIPTFMLDGRAANLQTQAEDAVRDHYEPEHLPTPEQLDTFATFQTSAGFFSSHELADFACGGQDPGLPGPEGLTDSQKRGRRFFVPEEQPVAGSGKPRHFTCASCHAGPLLNKSLFNPAGPAAVPDGTRFGDNNVPVVRARADQLIDFTITDIDGVQRTLTTGDPGRLLIPECDGSQGCEKGNFRCRSPCTTNVAGFVTCGACIMCSNLSSPSAGGHAEPFVDFNPALAGRENNICGLLPGLRVNATKTPSLRGIARTAPFFHDNSAATLRDVVRHYQGFFEFHFRRTCTDVDPASGACVKANLDARLSDQDVEDIVAFMELL